MNIGGFMDNFYQVDIYTSSEAIDGITGALQDYGITGFIIRDGADFEDFLADKNANWDYVDDSLMSLKTRSRVLRFTFTKTRRAGKLWKP